MLAILVVVVSGSPNRHAEAAQASGQRAGEIVALVYYPDASEASGVEVSLWRTGRHLSSARTDERGRVVFSSLADGRYTVRVNQQGFREAEVEHLLLGQVDTPKMVAMQLVEGEMTLGLGSLEGRVLSADGTSLPGLFVCATPPLSMCRTDLTTVTDADGRFRLEVPTRDPFVVVAVGKGYFGATVSAAPYNQVPGRAPVVVTAVAGRLFR